MARRQVKELDPYLKARIGEAVLQVRELAKPSNNQVQVEFTMRVIG
jgi:hypothetical protein